MLVQAHAALAGVFNVQAAARVLRLLLTIHLPTSDLFQINSSRG